jgi:hypothetical protein
VSAIPPRGPHASSCFILWPHEWSCPTIARCCDLPRLRSLFTLPSSCFCMTPLAASHSRQVNGKRAVGPRCLHCFIHVAALARQARQFVQRCSLIHQARVRVAVWKSSCKTDPLPRRKWSHPLGSQIRESTVVFRGACILRRLGWAWRSVATPERSAGEVRWAWLSKGR